MKLTELTSPQDLLTLTSDLVKKAFKKNVPIWLERLNLLALAEMDEEERKSVIEEEVNRALKLVPEKVRCTRVNQLAILMSLFSLGFSPSVAICN
jgi:hypothetical protein